LFRAGKFRRIACVLLAALLVVIQQVGFAHALTHIGVPQKSSRSDTQHPGAKVCTECIAFAQLGSGLTSHVSHVSLPAPQIAVVAAPLRAYDPAFVPHYHSRAPPSRV